MLGKELQQFTKGQFLMFIRFLINMKEDLKSKWTVTNNHISDLNQQIQQQQTQHNQDVTSYQQTIAQHTQQNTDAVQRQHNLQREVLALKSTVQGLTQRLASTIPTTPTLALDAPSQSRAIMPPDNSQATAVSQAPANQIQSNLPSFQTLALQPTNRSSAFQPIPFNSSSNYPLRLLSQQQTITIPPQVSNFQPVQLQPPQLSIQQSNQQNQQPAPQMVQHPFPPAPSQAVKNR